MMIRSDNRLEQVKEEVLLFAPYTTSISQLSNLIKGSRSSIYRAFRYSKNLKLRVKEVIGSKAQDIPPTIIETKKKVVSIPKSNREKSISDEGKLSQLKISDIKGDKGNERIVEVEVPRTNFQFYKTHHTPQQRKDKSIEIFRLILKGYPVYEACEINELGNSTFYSWLRKYPIVKSIYNDAVNIFQTYKEDEFLMRSYNELEKQLKEREVSITDKIGVPDKNGKITTYKVIKKTYTKEPNLKAIFKVLTTLCSDKFGTEKEREKAKEKEIDGIDYSLRSTEELEEELKLLNIELESTT